MPNPSNAKAKTIIKEIQNAHKDLVDVKNRIHTFIRESNARGNNLKYITENHKKKFGYFQRRKRLQNVLYKALNASNPKRKNMPGAESKRVQAYIQFVINDLKTDVSKEFNRLFNYPEKKYFKNIRTVNGLKKKRKELYLKLHPNRGGNGNEFTIMNRQYKNKLRELS